MREHVSCALGDANGALEALINDGPAIEAIVEAGKVLTNALAGDGRAFSCGNGGSMCDAMHFAEELTGRFRRDRRALPAIAISDAAHISCSANDFGYDQVFGRFIEAHGKAGDVLLAISTSGRSPNILVAAEAARSRQMSVIGLVGVAHSPLVDLATVAIVTPAGAHADRVQELHIKVIHVLIELIERALFPANYSVAAPAP